MVRKAFPFLVSMLATLLVAGCGGSEEAGDPCAGMSCPKNHDCVKGQCVPRAEPEEGECTVDEDCAFHPRGTTCDTAFGRCVSCFEDEDCDNGRFCDGGVCRGEVCAFDIDCLDEEGQPLEEGKVRCAPAGDACVECLVNEDCESGTCEAGICAEAPRFCEGDEDCRATERCAGEVCIALHCEDHSDCADFEGRSCHDGFCQARCGSDADCTDDPRGPYCTVETGVCGVCGVAGERSIGCAPGSACVADADGMRCEVLSCDAEKGLDACPSGSLCGDDGLCEDVSSCSEQDATCADARRPFCDVDAGRCFECEVSSDCSSRLERCIEGICQSAGECEVDSQCDGGFFCVEELCTACREDLHCPRGVCEEGLCVDRATCTSDAHCSSGRCADGACVACVGDLDCAPGLRCEEGACVAGPDCGPGRSCEAGTVCQSGSCEPASCEDDGAEPDGSHVLAQPVEYDVDYERVLCPNDEDWFAFEGVSGTRISLHLKDAPTDAELSLVWFSADGQRVRHEKKGVAGVWKGPLPPAAAGRYFARVRSVENASGSYSLRLEREQRCVDLLEPNSRTNAREIPLGVLLEDLSLCVWGQTGEVGDADFYVVDVPGQRKLTFTVTYEDGDAVNLAAFDDEGDSLPAGRVTVVHQDGVSTLTVAQGTAPRLILRVQPGVGERPSKYSAIAVVDDGLSCGAGTPLLAPGQREARVSGSALGYASARVTPCGQVMRWFPVVLSAESRVVVEAEGSFSPGLAWMGSGCSGGELCVSGSEGKGRLDLAAVPAGSYVLGVIAPPNAGAWFDLAIRLYDPLPTPGNDVCVDAEPVNLPGLSQTVRVEGSTSGAMPDMAHACGPMGPDLFYEVDVLSSGRLVAVAESSDPMVLFLSNGACNASTECGENVLDVSGLTPGKHVVGVSSVTGSYASFALEFTSPESLPHDGCGSAMELPLGVTIQGSTRWASNQLSYPIQQSCTGYYLGGHDLFFRVPGLSSGQQITVRLEPEEGYDGAVYIIDACPAGGQAPVCLAGADEKGKGGVETLTYTTKRAGDHFIVVDGAHLGGDFYLRVTSP